MTEGTQEPMRDEDRSILDTVFEKANPAKGQPVYAVLVTVYEGGELDFTMGGNKNIKLPTTETVKALTFGQFIKKGISDLLSGELLAEGYNLISNVIDRAAGEIETEE